MKKKKVLIASYNLDLGGIEKSLINLLNNMNYLKYDVTLILEKKEGIFLDKINQNVKVIEYKVLSNKNILLRKIINFINRIKYILKHYHKYDFACCYATYSYPANMLAYYASRNNVLYIHTNYKYVYDYPNLRKFFDTRRINKFRKIIFVSNESKKDLIEYYPSIKDKSIVINNLIDYKEIEVLKDEKISYEKPAKKLFVFVGRLDEKSKRITRLIEVAKTLDIELWIIGDGCDLKLYQELIKGYQNIKLMGRKVNPYPYMMLADYIVLSSDYEGFPVIYNEAILLNKKIITTIDVSDDYISIKNRFGYIVSKDINKMIKEIEYLLQNDDLKMEKVDFRKLNQERIKKIEEIIDEVI